MTIRHTLLAILLLAHSALAQWVRRTDVGSPGQRTGHAMAYDKDRGVTVFFGGEIGPGGGESYFDDTWEYDGIQWRHITITGTGPDNRSGHAMCYDTVRHEVLLSGGVNEDGYLRDCWAYHSTGPGQGVWTPRPHLPNMYYGGGIAGHAMVFDESAGCAVVTGGSAYYDLWYDVYGDGRVGISYIFSYDGTAWSNKGVMPENRSRHAMAYDRGLGRAVLFGGRYLASPKPGDDLQAFRDRINNRGRDDYNLGYMLTVEVEETDAHRLAFGSISPAPTQQSAMVYDELRERLVIFGGVGAYGSTLFELQANPAYPNDPVWYPGSRVYVYWNAVALNLPVSPSSRAGHSMVYDSRRHVTVMVGGASGGTRFDDTWELPSIPATGPTWVDFNHVGGNFGSAQFPFTTLAQAVRAASIANRDISIVGPRATSETITIRDAMTLRAVGGPITIGRR